MIRPTLAARWALSAQAYKPVALTVRLDAEKVRLCPHESHHLLILFFSRRLLPFGTRLRDRQRSPNMRGPLGINRRGFSNRNGLYNPWSRWWVRNHDRGCWSRLCIQFRQLRRPSLYSIRSRNSEGEYCCYWRSSWRWHWCPHPYCPPRLVPPTAEKAQEDIGTWRARVRTYPIYEWPTSNGDRGCHARLQSCLPRRPRPNRYEQVQPPLVTKLFRRRIWLPLRGFSDSGDLVRE
jgi:hypothetical protein